MVNDAIRKYKNAGRYRGVLKNYSSDEIMVAPAAVIPHQDNDFQDYQWVDLIVGLGTVIANPTSEVLAKI